MNLRSCAAALIALVSTAGPSPERLILQDMK